MKQCHERVQSETFRMCYSNFKSLLKRQSCKRDQTKRRSANVWMQQLSVAEEATNTSHTHTTPQTESIAQQKKHATGSFHKRARGYEVSKHCSCFQEEATKRKCTPLQVTAKGMPLTPHATDVFHGSVSLLGHLSGIVVNLFRLR